jgi:hypothetical protein
MHPAMMLINSLLPFFFEIEVCDRAPGYCATCGYDLRGLTSGRCPECGHEIPALS